MSTTPAAILDVALQKAEASIAQPIVTNPSIAEKIDYVSRYVGNRAVVRLLLACSLAAIHRGNVDIRKPYTEIGTPDAYSGRYYDESYITAFINKHELPCNPTTAFLTPALRNRNITLTPAVNLVGRPPKLYEAALQLLDDVHQGRITAEELLAQTIRCLIIARNEKRQRMETLLADLKKSEDAIPLSAEEIITLLKQHLACRGSSRLPVLIVAAAYQVAEQYIGERFLPLESHNAADEQTGALGDLEITLVDDEKVITSYEMKTRRVTLADIDRALQKINSTGKRVDNYIFITTDAIEEGIQEYASIMYDRTDGIEIVVLDCISFVRHFLHLFHRLRSQFLSAYQQLVLTEPDSAVSQPLKEAFLALRQAAESAREF
ncbi:D12 class N6 adenine-specific DNA methyltransferase [Nostoc commune NIES-4072]|uniref:D12 class N6 adenine-specific DNA methyltransferase n=1 Tax=Nostoc commune NIES-4072 TaxID=2005467 RepID=A0A2R5G1A5_NOSCO|nr:restriction endonuclease, SacI family [Nostoc commune]BBD66754.1 D12 class N6 adenine-specific DNA methyltransferase [Nostoc commune HK-02]GBG22263.1 D12 class N6 adenine-specific DNA methyltransferase [Nostoc commune NIES-4072]